MAVEEENYLAVVEEGDRTLSAVNHSLFEEFHAAHIDEASYEKSQMEEEEHVVDVGHIFLLDRHVAVSQQGKVAKHHSSDEPDGKDCKAAVVQFQVIEYTGCFALVFLLLLVLGLAREPSTLGTCLSRGRCASALGLG